MPPSRLQLEEERLVAIDVEYTHLQILPGRRRVGLPTEVCALDATGRTLLHEHCNPLGQWRSGWLACRSCGGLQRRRRMHAMLLAAAVPTP